MHELRHHLPFAIVATVVGIVIAFILKYYLGNFSKLENSFEFLHVLHISVSAIVSSGIYYKYRKKIMPSLLIGIISSIVVGSLSDAIFPYLGSIIFNINTTFHFPLLEMPFIIISGALLGSVIGISLGFTKLPHFGHVLVSTFASLFYLLAFTGTITIWVFIGGFVITIFAVLIPCCFSDIIFPFLFMGEKIKHCNC